MKLSSLCRVELRRLALSKFTWIAAAISLLGCLPGYWMPMSNPSVMTGMYLASPVLAGTAVGAVIWAILALMEADRVHRAKTDALLDAVVSPVRAALARLFALAVISAAACVLCALVYLPYAVIKLDYLFSFGLYAASFLFLMLPTWWISVMLAAALYQITRRIELAGLLYAVCVILGLGCLAMNDFFGSWHLPLIPTYSDGFSSNFYLRIALYTRLLWLALAGGLWTLSLLCIRRYQKNLARSFRRGLKKIYLPVTAVLLAAAGAAMWLGQPFVDHGPAEYQPLFYTRDASVEASAVTYRLTARTWTGRLRGTAEYNLTGARGDVPMSVWLDPSYKVLKITCDGEKIAFDTTSVIEQDARRTDFCLPAGGQQNLSVEYEGYPSMRRCFAPYGGSEVNADYVSLTGASSVPDIRELALPETCALELTLPGHLTPIVGHRRLTDFTENPDGTKFWREKEMESWGSIRITAGNYAAEPLTAAGMDIDFVFSRKYEKVMAEYQICDAIAEVLDWCTGRLGRLSWTEARRLLMVQRSAVFGGGNAGEGWVEWTEDIFTANNLSDPLKGASANEVFVHEMVHWWWGGLGVNLGEEWGRDAGDFWSNEGLTVYTTYRIMKERYGELYAKQYYIDVWQAAVDIQERGFYYRHPEYLDKLPESYRANLNNMSRSTNLYCRMPLMILKAEQLVGGEARMDEILRRIQREYGQNGYENPFTYQQFLDFCGLREEDLILG